MVEPWLLNAARGSPTRVCADLPAVHEHDLLSGRPANAAPPGLHGARPGTRQPLRSSFRRTLAAAREPASQAPGSHLPSSHLSSPGTERSPRPSIASEDLAEIPAGSGRAVATMAESGDARDEVIDDDQNDLGRRSSSRLR